MAQSASTDLPILVGVRRHLESLKRSPRGIALYELIERGWQDFKPAEGEYADFLEEVLVEFAKDPTNDPATRIKARLIQQHVALQRAVATKANEEQATISPEIGSSLAPTAAADPVEVGPMPLIVGETNSDTPQDFGEDTEANSKIALANTDAPVVDAPTQSARAAIEDTIKDVSNLKQLLITGLDELNREREALKQKLNSAAEYLKALEAEREQLRGELAHIRKHKEKAGGKDYRGRSNGKNAKRSNGPPRRETFVRILEAELGRVKRYGHTLSLALIDIDSIEGIDGVAPEEVADKVLDCYWHEVLSNFRLHDIVAPFGGNEFSVVFPHTSLEGALKALEKVQKRATETYLNYGGKSVALPAFYSALTVYHPGDKPASLLRRAGETLKRARHAGAARIVFDQGEIH